MFPWLKLKNNYDIIITAVVIAIIMGLGTSIFFMVIEKESYSAIYIVPGSIIHNPEDNSVLYTYGVKSSEAGKMDYVLDTYIDTTLLKTGKFSLNRGQILDERDKITLPPGTKYPVKISLKLSSDSETEEIHFWLKENG